MSINYGDASSFAVIATDLSNLGTVTAPQFA